MARVTRITTVERDAARERLRGMLKPGDTLHTVLRHVSNSGMSRSIDVYRLYVPKGAKEADRLWLSRLIATACGHSWDAKRDCIKVAGAGMDMGFSIVYDLGWALWPNGAPCSGEICHSNDHSNGMRERGRGIVHSDAGYALRQVWL